MAPILTSSLESEPRMNNIGQTETDAAADDDDTHMLASQSTLVLQIKEQIYFVGTALLDGHDIPELVLDISPSNHTHNLSIVQIDTAEEINNNKSTNDGKIGNGTFLIGMASRE